MCQSHQDIGIALEVWREQPSSGDVEQLYRQKGGGRGKLQHYFTPVVKDAGSPSKRTPSSKPRTNNSHRHWGHPMGAAYAPLSPPDRLAIDDDKGNPLIWVERCMLDTLREWLRRHSGAASISFNCLLHQIVCKHSDHPHHLTSLISK